jgi:peptide-methionine (R)-S-oxide reductase
MILSRRTLLGGALALGTLGLVRAGSSATPARRERFEVEKTDAEWKALLSPAAYEVLRKEGTERAGTSSLLNEHRDGAFLCAGCALPLFSSKTKFESHTGWPSFYAPLRDSVETSQDTSFLMVRTEVHCRRCGGHLGHVFDDGPPPTGLRYCMNGVALTFRPGAA